MPKIAYNACYGGFSLSRAAVLRGREISGNPFWNGPCMVGDEYDTGEVVTDNFGFLDRDMARHDKVLVQVIEELGKEAGGRFAQLELAELPSGSSYIIDEYDGLESVKTAEDYDWIQVP